MVRARSLTLSNVISSFVRIGSQNKITKYLNENIHGWLKTSFSFDVIERFTKGNREIMHQMVLLETIPSLRKAKKSLPKRWWAKDPARRITYFTIYTIILGKKVEEEEIQHEEKHVRFPVLVVVLNNRQYLSLSSIWTMQLFSKQARGNPMACQRASIHSLAVCIGIIIFLFMSRGIFTPQIIHDFKVPNLKSRIAYRTLFSPFQRRQSLYITPRKNWSISWSKI